MSFSMLWRGIASPRGKSWIRRSVAWIAATSFLWSFLLAAPAQALAQQTERKDATAATLARLRAKLPKPAPRPKSYRLPVKPLTARQLARLKALSVTSARLPRVSTLLDEDSQWLT